MTLAVERGVKQQINLNLICRGVSGGGGGGGGGIQSECTDEHMYSLLVSHS